MTNIKGIRKHISKISIWVLFVTVALFWHCTEIPHYQDWVNTSVDTTSDSLNGVESELPNIK
jgi:hypothetical protein